MAQNRLPSSVRTLNENLISSLLAFKS